MTGDEREMEDVNTVGQISPTDGPHSKNNGEDEQSAGGALCRRNRHFQKKYCEEGKC